MGAVEDDDVLDSFGTATQPLLNAIKALLKAKKAKKIIAADLKAKKAKLLALLKSKGQFTEDEKNEILALIESGKLDPNDVDVDESDIPDAAVEDDDVLDSFGTANQPHLNAIKALLKDKKAKKITLLKAKEIKRKLAIKARLKAKKAKKIAVIADVLKAKKAKKIALLRAKKAKKIAIIAAILKAKRAKKIAIVAKLKTKFKKFIAKKKSLLLAPF